MEQRREPWGEGLGVALGVSEPRLAQKPHLSSQTGSDHPLSKRAAAGKREATVVRQGDADCSRQGLRGREGERSALPKTRLS